MTTFDIGGLPLSYTIDTIEGVKEDAPQSAHYLAAHGLHPGPGNTQTIATGVRIRLNTDLESMGTDVAGAARNLVAALRHAADEIETRLP